MSETVIGVVTFPGTLDDNDAKRAIRLSGAKVKSIWHEDSTLGDVSALVIPGGFSYGDYLRAGAIAAKSRIMVDVIDKANKGLPILGICNGFQILVEAGLLPGGLIKNQNQSFIRKDQSLKVLNNQTPFTCNFEKDEEIIIPLKNGDGCFIATEETLKEIEDNNQVVFQYSNTNPNGSQNNIAGVCNRNRNIVGLMPHPEHAVEPGFGPDTASALRSGLDGLKFFSSVIESTIIK